MIQKKKKKKKKRGKVLGEQQLKLFETVKDISKGMYKDYSQRSQYIIMNYFPYFCLLKNYSNYYFHVLVIKN